MSKHKKKIHDARENRDKVNKETQQSRKNKINQRIDAQDKGKIR